MKKDKISWQNNKNWTEINQIIEDAHDKEEEQRKNEGHPTIKIPIYSSDGPSIWGIIKSWFTRKTN